MICRIHNNETTETEYLSLNEYQYRLMNWLIEGDLFRDDVEIELPEFEDGLGILTI